MGVLQKYAPKAASPALTSTGALSLVGELLLFLAAPEVGAPALILGIGSLLANPTKFAAYVAIARDTLLMLDLALDVYLKLQQVGFLDNTSGCCEKIVNALYVENPDHTKTSIAEFLKRLSTSTITDNNGVSKEVYAAATARAIYETLFYSLDESKKMTITDALAKLVLTGVLTTYQGVPQSPSNP